MVHEHLYYPTGPGVYGQLGESFTRLYLAGGVTTMRTGGNVNGFMDINLKRADRSRRRSPGPAIDATAPYVNGPNTFVQMHSSQRRRRGAPARRLLGRGGRDVGQGVHADLARGARRGDRRSAQARHEGHRAPLLGHLQRSRRSRHRQSRARVSRGDGLRRATSSRTSVRVRAAVSRRSRRSTKTARRSRRS